MFSRNLISIIYFLFQLQVHLQLPCYDFITIGCFFLKTINFAFSKKDSFHNVTGGMYKA